MNNQRKLSLRIFLATFVMLVSTRSLAEDWTQWNGPRRDGSLNDANTRASIPKDGLPLLWRRSVSFGYSGPIVADGRVFVADYIKTSGNIINNAGARDKLTGRERVSCFDASSGEKLWRYEYSRDYAVSYGGGPRATPSYHEGVLYFLGSEGDLTAIRSDDGSRLWHRQFNEEFGARTPMWGHAASPLVEDGKLICLVGGNDSLVVAFDLKTGNVIWKSLSGEETGYCPPIILDQAGTRQLLVWSPTTISSLNPSTGAVLWEKELKPDYGMSILPPISDGNLLFTSGEGKSLMLKLSAGEPGSTELWRGAPKEGVFLATSNAIFHEGHLYGADIRSGALVCARGVDGKRLWQTALPTTGSTRGRGGAHASAFLIRLVGDGRTGNDYLILAETGAFISASLTPAGYKETGRFQAIDPLLKTMGRTVLWTYPAIANGKLYIRNDNEIVCYSISN